MFNTLFLPEIREMLASENQQELREFCHAIHPAAAAEFMGGLTANEAWQVLQFADEHTRNDIFLYLDREQQLEIIGSEDRELLAAMVGSMAPDDRVDLLQDVDESIVDEVLALLPTEERRDILRLRAHPEYTAGAVMTTAVAKLPETHTVQQALQALQQQSDEYETIYYLYIVDDSNHLRGLVSTRDLISHLNKPELQLSDFMETELITADLDEDKEDVAQKVAKYDLLAIPVVDNQHHMMGIITYDDVIDVMMEEAVEDAHRIAGVDPLDESYLRTSILTLSWKRGIWLAVLFMFALFTAFALKNYEEQLKMWHWLGLFVPLIISSGGNTGSQSATLIITALVRGEVNLSDWVVVIRRELLSGLILGGFLAVMGYFAAYWLIPETPGVALWKAAFVLPVTILLVVLCGTLFGSMLPLAFEKMGLDPALMSSPFVAGIIDIVGIVVYLNVAIWLLA